MDLIKQYVDICEKKEKEKNSLKHIKDSELTVSFDNRVIGTFHATEIGINSPSSGELEERIASSIFRSQIDQHNKMRHRMLEEERMGTMLEMIERLRRP